MLSLTLYVVSLLAAVSAVPPTGDDDPFPQIGFNISVPRSFNSSVSRSAALPDVKYTEALKLVKHVDKKINGVLLKVPPRLDDPKLHEFLVWGLISATANLLAQSSNKLSPEDAYKKVINEKLVFLLNSPVNASDELAKTITTIKFALHPLITSVESRCNNIEGVICDQLMVSIVMSDPDLLERVNILDRMILLAKMYLGVEKQVELAAMRLNGIGYSMNNVVSQAILSNLLAQVLNMMNTKKIPL